MSCTVPVPAMDSARPSIGSVRERARIGPAPSGEVLHDDGEMFPADRMGESRRDRALALAGARTGHDDGRAGSPASSRSSLRSVGLGSHGVAARG